MSQAASARAWTLSADLPALPAAAGVCGGVLLWTVCGHLVLPLILACIGVALILLRRHAAGCLIAAAATGWVAAEVNSPGPLPEGLIDSGEMTVTATVRRTIPKSYRNLYVLEVEEIALKQVESQSISPFRLALTSGFDTEPFVPGNRIRAKVKLHPATGQHSCNYYRNLGVSSVATALPDDISLIDGHVNFAGWWFEQRMRLSALLARSDLSAESFGLLNALILGLGDDLPADYRDNYRLTGTAHVLALSGFHVGFIYAAISLLLIPLGVWWRFRKLRLSLGIAVIWGYALLTGLAPGVVRAAIGLTIVLLALIYGRMTSGLNNLCVAVALIACVWPFSIFLPSLQLSVAATAGILLFMYLFSYKDSPPLRRRLIDLVAVPCGAVFATAPLLIFYFHSLPLCFLVANLVAVLLVAPLVWVGIVRMLLTALGIAAHWLDAAIDTVVDIAGKIFAAIAELSPSTGPLRLSAAQVSLLMIVIALVAIILTRYNLKTIPRPAWIVPVLLIAVPFLGDRLPEAEAYVLRGGATPAVVMRTGNSAAACVTCEVREYDAAVRNVSRTLSRYNDVRGADTIMITRNDLTLGPFSRRGDTLYIENQKFCISDLLRSDIERIL